MDLRYFQSIKAAFKKADKPLLASWGTETEITDIPEISIEKLISADRVSASSAIFNIVHHWQYDTLHPCLPLFLGLPLHIAVLTNKRSPFPLMGLVHTENAIIQNTPLSLCAINIRCYFGNIRSGPRGVEVDIITDICQNNALCQTIKSTYLYRQVPNTLADSTQGKSNMAAQLTPDTTSQLSFDACAGLRYARIAGDYNPIHLFTWSARIFGFKQAIAHGTHVLARCISTITTPDNLPANGFSITNDFRYPVPLPSRLTVSSSEYNAGSEAHSLSFELRNPAAARRKQIVLSGRIAN